MFKKVRNFMLGFGSVAMISLPLLAEGEPVANAEVVNAFESLAEQIIATLGSVALAAVGIAAIILAFRYGRKLLSTIAK